MASIYDNIKTPKELVDMVRLRGLSTALEDICKAQDIFGRAPISSLVELANDNGRVDANGNPDPKGSWSKGREGTQKTFYMILFSIWNWEEATRFYNEHTNPEFEALRAKALKLTSVEATLIGTVDDLQEAKKALVDAGAMFIEQEKKASKLEKENAELADEIIRLKAKLYDMMEKVSKEG
ncbi:MAG: hypothetical protein E7661_00695 [Ruminococcaceae bacterium]|nr:hypothetical protein [Oscillospiraceae bacterium]